MKHWIEVTCHLLACLIVQNNHLTINSSMPNNFHIRLAVALVMKLYSTASKLKGSRTTAKTKDKSNAEVNCIGFQCLQCSLSTFRIHIVAAW